MNSAPPFALRYQYGVITDKVRIDPVIIPQFEQGRIGGYQRQEEKDANLGYV